jgi:hypothetical protein
LLNIRTPIRISALASLETRAMKEKMTMMHVLSIIRIIAALFFPDVKRAETARSAG